MTAATPKTRTHRSLSIPLLVGTLVALAVFLPGLYFWRARQVDKGAQAYVERAEALAQEGQWAQSAEYLFLYLRMRPEDAKVRIQLAETYDRLADRTKQLERAVDLYYQALAVAEPDRQGPLRQRLTELLIQSENFASAKLEVEKLLAADPQGAAAQRLLALTLYGETQSVDGKSDTRARPAVGAALEQAARLNPADVQLAATLADVYRREPLLQSTETRAMSDEQRAAAADQCLDRLVSADPKQATAFLARYQYQSTYGLLRSTADLDQALALAPESPVVLLTAAVDRSRKALDPSVEASDERRQLLDQSAQFYERAIRALPSLERAYLGLGGVQALQGQVELAQKTWETGLERCGKESIGLNAGLAELLISQGNLDRAEQCIEAINAAAARLRQQGYTEAQLDFVGAADLLKARVLIAKQKTDEAIELLRRLGSERRGAATNEGSVAYQALMLLGNTYLSQGQVELATKVFADAAFAQPKAAEPHLAAANLSMVSGRPDLAVDHLEKAVAVDDTAANRMLLAGAQISHQLQLPVAERNWPAVEQLLADAKSAQAKGDDKEAWKISILESQYLLRRSEEKGDRAAGVDAALQVLRAAEGKAAASPDGLGNLAAAFDDLGSAADADRLLDQLQTASPKSPSAYLAASNILARRKQFAKARALVEQGLAAVPADQRRPLQIRRVDLLSQEGRMEDAWTALSELQRQTPSDRNLLQRLLDFALENGKYAEAETLEAAFGKLPGVTDVDKQFFQARRLLLQASGPQDPKLNEVEKIVTEIERQRPRWPAAQLLKGQLLTSRGNLEMAADAYREAIILGEQRLEVYERLVMLLYQLKRFDEANDYLNDLRDRSATSAGLSSLEMSLALRSGQLDRAVQSTQQGAAARASDPLAQVWLAQLLLADDKPDEAEKALKRALELGPSDPRVYGALVNYFLSINRIDRARAALEQFSRKTDVPESQRELMLARGYDAIGDHEQALAHFRAAETREPESAEVQVSIAASLMSRDPKAAEKALRRALELNPRSDMARRMLAGLLVLADRSGQPKWDEALQLLDAAGDSSGSQKMQPADQRLQALLLTRRAGTDDLAAAQRILEKLVANPQAASLQDRLLLAQVKEQAGSQAARQDYLSLASESPPRPEHVAAFVDWLLRHDEVDEAGKWLDKLDELKPDVFMAMALRVRWLTASEQTQQIEPLLESTADRLLQGKNVTGTPDTRQEVAVCTSIGDLFLSVPQYAAAERWYRRAYERDAQQYATLARSIVEQGRFSEALELCIRAAANDPSHRPAMVLATLLMLTPPSDRDAASAESLLTKTLQAHGDNPELLLVLGNLRFVQRNFQEAARLFRRVVELQPGNIEALNNLAMTLSEQPGQAAEALPYVDRAIELAGSQPNLLDTKGTILLALDRIQEAVSVMQVAALAPNPDPRHHFHLAIGYYRQGELDRAREMLASAQRRNLARQVLSESDTRLLKELETNLQ